jgi:hypothetical protein
VEKQIKAAASAELSEKFDTVRHALETAGFHTRSHAAPGA